MKFADPTEVLRSSNPKSSQIHRPNGFILIFSDQLCHDFETKAKRPREEVHDAAIMDKKRLTLLMPYLYFRLKYYKGGV